MSQTIIRQALSQYSCVVYGGRPLFTYHAVFDFAQNLKGFTCLLPLGRIEQGDRSSPREMLWEVRADGDPVPFSRLTDTDQIRLRKQLQDSLDALQREAKRLKAEGSKAGKDLGTILEKVECPSEEFLYVINGKLVITGWGLSEDGPEPTMMTAFVEEAPPSRPSALAAAIPEPDLELPPEPAPPPITPPSAAPFRPGPPPLRGPDRKTDHDVSDKKWWVLIPLCLLLAFLLGYLVWWLMSRTGTLRVEDPRIRITETDTDRGAYVPWSSTIARVPPQVTDAEKPAPPVEPKKPQRLVTKPESEPKLKAAPEPEPSPEDEWLEVWDDSVGRSVRIRRTDPAFSQGRVVWDPDAKRRRCTGCAASETSRGPGNVETESAVITSEGDWVSIKRLRLTPPEKDTRWSLSIDGSSSEDVKKSPGAYIQFFDPEHGLQGLASKGSEVWVAMKGGIGFKARVDAVTPGGIKATHIIEIHGPVR